jgi:hypothetical protein
VKSCQCEPMIKDIPSISDCSISVGAAELSPRVGKLIFEGNGEVILSASISRVCGDILTRPGAKLAPRAT